MYILYPSVIFSYYQAACNDRLISNVRAQYTCSSCCSLTKYFYIRASNKMAKIFNKIVKKNPKQCLSRFVEFCSMILEKTFRSFQCNLLFSFSIPILYKDLNIQLTMMICDKRARVK